MAGFVQVVSGNKECVWVLRMDDGRLFVCVCV